MTGTGSLDHPAQRRGQAACPAAFSRKSLVAALALALPAAYATEPPDTPDTFDFVLGARVLYDDNLFRLSDSESPLPFVGKSQKSDLIYATSAGIKVDKPYAQQRFQLDASVIDNRYQTYDFLNHPAFNYRGAWLWHVTPRISGILLAEQKQELNNFSDFRNFGQKSIQTNQTHLFTVDGDIGAGVHLLGGLLDVRSRNSEDFEAVGDYSQSGAEFGVKYVSRAQNWISLMQRETTGEYRGRALDPVAQLDSGFDEGMTEAALGWRLSGKSEIEARLGYVDRKHDNFLRRDYSGTVGRLLYRWKPTGKLQLEASLSRNLFSFQEDANSYFVADTLSISPIWKYSPKTTLRLRYSYGNLDYRGAIVPTAELREDRAQSLQFAVDWKATRKLTVTGTLQHIRRDSNLGDYDYASNSAGVNVQFLF
jgi:exopolysaccharide biosynthesis operon protein EpsL